MTKITQFLDQTTEYIGRALALLSIAIMALTFLVVVLRYGFNHNAIGWDGFNLSAIALQESVIYLHAALFMLASGYTLKQNAHVRVDVLYRKFSPRGKALVDLLGSLFLLFPMCGFILVSSLDFVAFSWSIQERSAEAEGLPYLYLLKTLIPLMAILLIWQGLADVLRNGAVLMGRQHG